MSLSERIVITVTVAYGLHPISGRLRTGMLIVALVLMDNLYAHAMQFPSLGSDFLCMRQHAFHMQPWQRAQQPTPHSTRVYRQPATYLGVTR